MNIGFNATELNTEAPPINTEIVEKAKKAMQQMREGQNAYLDLILSISFEDPAVQEIREWMIEFQQELEMDQIMYQMKLLEKRKKEGKAKDPPAEKTRSIGFLH